MNLKLKNSQNQSCLKNKNHETNSTTNKSQLQLLKNQYNGIDSDLEDELAFNNVEQQESLMHKPDQSFLNKMLNASPYQLNSQKKDTESVVLSTSKEIQERMNKNDEQKLELHQKNQVVSLNLLQNKGLQQNQGKNNQNTYPNINIFNQDVKELSINKKKYPYQKYESHIQLQQSNSQKSEAIIGKSENLDFNEKSFIELVINNSRKHQLSPKKFNMHEQFQFLHNLNESYSNNRLLENNLSYFNSLNRGQIVRNEKAYNKYVEVDKYIKVKRIFRNLKSAQIVRNFVIIMLSLVNKKLFDNLNPIHYQIIKDKSYFSPEDIAKRNDELFFIEKIKFLFSKIPVFNPNSPIIIYQQIFMLILIQFFLLAAPIQIIFYFRYKEWSLIFLYILPVVVFFTDILINCNIYYYDSGLVISDRSKIIKRYLKKDFWFDFIPLISMIIDEEFLYDQSSNVLVFLQILRVQQTNRVMFKVYSYFNLNERYPTFMTLFNLIYLITLIAHVCGTGFIYVAQRENSDESWIKIYRFAEIDNNMALYIDGLYFAFITMITVGYGDISPITPAEKVYAIVMTLLSCGVFAYALNIVGTIFKNIQELNAQRKKERYQLLKFLEKKQIKKELQLKALKALDLAHQIQIESEDNLGYHVLQELSTELKNEVLKEYYLRILNKSKILTEYFSIDMLNALAIQMKEKIYGPGEIVFNQNETDQKLTFLIKGELDIKYSRQIYNHLQKCKFREQYNNILFPDDKSFHAYTLQNQGIIGFDSIFTSNQKQYSVISKTKSNIVYLTKQDFELAVKDLPSDNEKFQMLKEDIISGKIFPEKCPLCFSKQIQMENNSSNLNQNQQNEMQKYSKQIENHGITNCFLINYRPNKYLCVTNDKIQNSDYFNRQKTIFQQRNDFKRSCFKNFLDINVSARQYRIENANQMTYDKNEVYYDFYDVADREFICNIKIIPLWDEEIRLKYIESNFASDYQDEDIPEYSSYTESYYDEEDDNKADNLDLQIQKEAQQMQQMQALPQTQNQQNQEEMENKIIKETNSDQNISLQKTSSIQDNQQKYQNSKSPKFIYQSGSNDDEKNSQSIKKITGNAVKKNQNDYSNSNISLNNISLNKYQQSPEKGGLPFQNNLNQSLTQRQTNNTQLINQNQSNQININIEKSLDSNTSESYPEIKEKQLIHYKIENEIQDENFREDENEAPKLDIQCLKFSARPILKNKIQKKNQPLFQNNTTTTINNIQQNNSNMMFNIDTVSIKSRESKKKVTILKNKDRKFQSNKKSHKIKKMASHGDYTEIFQQSNKDFANPSSQYIQFNQQKDQNNNNINSNYSNNHNNSNQNQNCNGQKLQIQDRRSSRLLSSTLPNNEQKKMSYYQNYNKANFLEPNSLIPSKRQQMQKKSSFIDMIGNSYQSQVNNNKKNSLPGTFILDFNNQNTQGSVANPKIQNFYQNQKTTNNTGHFTNDFDKSEKFGHTQTFTTLNNEKSSFFTIEERAKDYRTKQAYLMLCIQRYFDKLQYFKTYRRDFNYTQVLQKVEQNQRQKQADFYKKKKKQNLNSSLMISNQIRDRNKSYQSAFNNIQNPLIKKSLKSSSDIQFDNNQGKQTDVIKNRNRIISQQLPKIKSNFECIQHENNNIFGKQNLQGVNLGLSDQNLYMIKSQMKNQAQTMQQKKKEQKLKKKKEQSKAKEQNQQAEQSELSLKKDHMNQLLQQYQIKPLNKTKINQSTLNHSLQNQCINKISDTQIPQLQKSNFNTQNKGIQQNSLLEVPGQLEMQQNLQNKQPQFQSNYMNNSLDPNLLIGSKGKNLRRNSRLVNVNDILENKMQQSNQRFQNDKIPAFSSVQFNALDYPQKEYQRRNSIGKDEV